MGNYTLKGNEPTVYVVTLEYRGGGHDVCGVFSTEAAARAYCDAAPDLMGVMVEGVDCDYDVTAIPVR